MNSQTRNEIKSIIRNMRDDMLDGKRVLPIFTFYESKEKFPDFTMEISPIDGLNCLNRYFEYSELEKVEKEYLKMKEFEKIKVENKSRK